MSDLLDTTLKAAHRFGRAAESPDLRAAYAAIPLQTRQSITQRDIELRSRTGVGDGEVALDYLITASPSLKLEVLKVADDTLGAIKAHYRNYDRLGEFWPPDAATAEVVDFLALHGNNNLANIAKAALRPTAPKNPSNDGLDRLTP